MAEDPEAKVLSAEAWTDFCELLKKAGDVALHEELGTSFYEAHAGVDSSRVQIVHAWIEPETINALFAQHGFSEEIDLLSVDIDGNDYWVWKAIKQVRPRAAATLLVTDQRQRGVSSAAFHPDYHVPGAPGQGKFYTSSSQVADVPADYPVPAGGQQAGEAGAQGQEGARLGYERAALARR